MLRHLRFHLRCQGKPLLPLWLLALFLASCQLIPSAAPPRSQALKAADILPAFSTKSETPAGQYEMLTFPSLVPPQKLEAVSPPLKTGTWFKLHFSTLPHKKPNKPKHIQVPEQGAFELTLQPGPEFKLLDANASDGLAVVQVPADVYQGYLRLAGEPATLAPRSLEYEDPLYYVKHTLGRNDNEPRFNQSFTLLGQNDTKLQLTSRCSPEPEIHRIWQVHNPTAQPVPYTWEIKDSDQEGSEVAPPGDSYLETQTEAAGKNALVLKVNGQKQDSLASKRDRCAPGQEPAAQTSKWWNLGSRALPTPPSWNLQQNGYTLKLKNQGITDFTVRLVRRPGEQLAMPLGMKEVGPAGGTVELPGVARLEIPAGALSENKMVKLSQLLQVPSRKRLCVNPNDPTRCNNGYVFATAIVKLEPLGLDLNQHAKLYTDLFPQYANTRFPFESGTLTPENPLSWNFGYLGVREEITSLDQLKPNDFILVKTFAYIAKEESYPGWEPPQSAQPHFKIQAQEPSGRVIINKDFIIEAKTNNIEAGALENAAGYLQVAYDHFTSEFVGLKPPFKWWPEKAPAHLKKIPVHLHPQVYYDGRPANGTASDPVFCDAPTAQAKCEPKGTLIELSTCRPFCDFHSQDGADSTVHELFHAFQMAYASQKSELPGNDDNWFIEGSAALVGPWVVSQKASTFQVAFDAKELPYQERVTSIDTLFVPFVTRKPTESYQTASFWGHLGLTHTLDIVFDLLKEYGINQKQKIGKTPRINKALHTIIQRKNSNNSLDLAYKHFAQDALFKQNLQVFDSSDFRQAHVNLIQMPSISTQQTSTAPLLIDQSIDSLATKYILLKPSPDLPDNSVLKVRFKSIDKREAYPNEPSSPIQVLDYLKPQLIGIQNPEGQGVLREANQDIVQKVGDFLPVEFEQEVSLTNFGPHSASKSAVLIIPNALWQLDSNYPIKPIFEVYIESKRFRSVDPDLIKAQKATQVLVQGTELESINQVIIQSTAHPYTVYTAQAAYNTDSNDLSVSVPGLTAGNYKMAGLLQSGAQCYIPTLQPPLDAPPPSGAPPSGSPPSGAPPSEPPTQDLCVLTNALSLGVTNSPPDSNLIQARRIFYIHMSRLDNVALMAFKQGETKPFYIRYASGDLAFQPTTNVQQAFMSRFGAYIDSSPDSGQIISFDLRPREPGNIYFNSQNSPFFDLSQIHGEIVIKVINWSPPPGQGSGVAEFVITSYAYADLPPEADRDQIDLAYRTDGHSMGINENHWEVVLETNESKNFGFNLPEFFTVGVDEIYFDYMTQYNIDPSSVTG